MSTPVTPEQVITYLGVAGSRDEEAISAVVDGVNSLLIAWKGDLDEWPAHFITGGVMLASRVYRRRNSPAGVENFGDVGVVYVQRNDPDVAQLLELGVYKRPQVG
ncbi:hypothetical protein AAFP35_08280 [Gordonia sp. CPCC 206044]|uniref:hypothetical protein n=1 Tax=Gordonia sp. CPCC 206044 TaxID=3140793 RepID=UPI003AF3D3C1